MGAKFDDPQFLARREAHFAEMRQSSEAKALNASGGMQVAIDLLAKRPRPPQKRWQVPEVPLDIWVIQATTSCLAEPDLAEKMTAKERKERAATITRHAEGLWDAIQPFMHSERSGFGWHLQPEMDLLALELSLDYTKDFELPEQELEEAQHRSRYAIYYALMQRLEDVLATVVSGAERFAETETIIKKPNDPNAKRLYFLRTMTEKLSRTFRAPCRGVALALAGTFFDCSDLDEASVSKLAPVQKRTPIEIPIEQLQWMVKRMEEELAKVGDSDPDKVEELTDHLNFYREWIAKSSA
jgi:hypothetical protein